MTFIPTQVEYDFIVVEVALQATLLLGAWLRIQRFPSWSLKLVLGMNCQLQAKRSLGDKVLTPGRNPRDIPEITTPARAFELRDSEYDWAYKTTFIDRPEYTRLEKPNTRGKVLGGSSCLNYYTWVPGSKATFDDWAAFGGDTWNWENCEKYFRKSATYHDDDKIYTAELSKVGLGGPLHISHSDLIPEMAPFRDALTKAWVSKGQKLTEDIYSGTMAGLVYCTNSIYKGFRSSSYVFVENKPNITILSNSHSKNLVIKDGAVTGVAVFGPNGKELTFSAIKEVIVSSGVFESPKLLLLSGIGPDEVLKPHDIKQVVASQHVGKNLLDHPILPHCFRLKDGLGLDDHLLRAGPMKTGAISAYKKDRTGPLSSGLLELVGFPRIDERLLKYKEYRAAKEKNGGLDPFGPGGQPHFEIDFPMFSDAFQWHIPTPPSGSWFTIIVDLLRPVSPPGQVKLKSANALDEPDVNLNFLADDLDVLALREGVRFVDDILLNGDGMKDIIGDDYPWPMPRASDAAMDKLILERMQTGFHPCGTARLSKSIEEGVVDSQLKVHGIKNLRVIDASVFPIIPDCRIQNAVYMVAEKGSDIIKAAYPELY